MKVVFISNSFNHHQKPFCDAMYSKIRDDYCFIETRPIRQERLDMGWGQEAKPDYVKQNYVSEAARRTCQELIDSADVVIHAHGSAPDELIRSRVKTNKLIFVYSERIYKKGCVYHKLPWHILLNYRRGYMRRNTYLLCASAYSAGDFAKTISFIGKTYKWGYFPQTKQYNLDALFRIKREKLRPSILWCGRFLEWKHPEIALLIAERLKQNGYEFDMNIIGSGEMEQELRDIISQKELGNYVKLLGTMSPEAVRTHMEATDIYLFSSDFNEGWGAVLNEAMNSACAVVASHAMGSAPFLIRDAENGFIYRYDDLDGAYDRVVRLIRQPDLREKMGRKAYHTITENWNAAIAAERFIHMADALLAGKDPVEYREGPCSKAKFISNGWYKNGKNF